jgi:hypothetical protein
VFRLQQVVISMGVINPRKVGKLERIAPKISFQEEFKPSYLKMKPLNSLICYINADIIDIHFKYGEQN